MEQLNPEILLKSRDLLKSGGSVWTSEDWPYNSQFFRHEFPKAVELHRVIIELNNPFPSCRSTLRVRCCFDNQKSKWKTVGFTDIARFPIISFDLYDVVDELLIEFKPFTICKRFSLYDVRCIGIPLKFPPQLFDINKLIDKERKEIQTAINELNPNLQIITHVPTEVCNDFLGRAASQMDELTHKLCLHCVELLNSQFPELKNYMIESRGKRGMDLDAFIENLTNPPQFQIDSADLKAATRSDSLARLATIKSPDDIPQELQSGNGNLTFNATILPPSHHNFVARASPGLTRNLRSLRRLVTIGGLMKNATSNRANLEAERELLAAQLRAEDWLARKVNLSSPHVREGGKKELSVTSGVVLSPSAITLGQKGLGTSKNGNNDTMCKVGLWTRDALFERLAIAGEVVEEARKSKAQLESEILKLDSKWKQEQEDRRKKDELFEEMEREKLRALQEMEDLREERRLLLEESERLRLEALKRIQKESKISKAQAENVTHDLIYGHQNDDDDNDDEMDAYVIDDEKSLRVHKIDEIGTIHHDFSQEDIKTIPKHISSKLGDAANEETRSVTAQTDGPFVIIPDISKLKSRIHPSAGSQSDHGKIKKLLDPLEPPPKDMFFDD